MEPEKSGNTTSAGSNFRDYVESLHQNSKSTLLYGKNNVVVQPVRILMYFSLGMLSYDLVLDNYLYFYSEYTVSGAIRKICILIKCHMLNDQFSLYAQLQDCTVTLA